MSDPDHDHHAHGAAPPPPGAGTTKPKPLRRAIVVGASSGIGAALVRELVASGYMVGALARRGDALEEIAGPHGARVTTRAHDVTCIADVQPAFEDVVTRLGGLDLFIYAAGIMPAVGPNAYDTEPDLAQVATNLSGAIAWCNEAARLFATQRRGTLVGISSVAGDRGRKMNPAYAATKAGLTTFLESLRNRLSEVGVRVVTIKPGPVATPMTSELGRMPFMISAEKAARTIVRTADGGLWSTRYVPLRWWPIMGVLRAIPSRIFRHLNV